MNIHKTIWKVSAMVALVLAGCVIRGKGAPVQPEATSSRSMVLIGTASTATVPAMPVQTLEFSNFESLRKTARFPIWMPGFVPKRSAVPAWLYRRLCEWQPEC